MMGLEKIIDKLLEFGEELIPWVVIPHYDRGVRLRLGRMSGKVMEPGLHLKLPFIDQICTMMVKMKTMNLSEQTITTKDWKSIVVKAVVKYEIKDVVLTLLETNDPVDAVNDMVKGIIRNTFIKKAWEECNTEDLAKEIKDRSKREGEKWGIKILDITLTDLGEVPSYRLFNSNTLASSVD